MATILAVDDSASMRQMVSFTLKGNGHTVIEASDGLEALQKVEQHPVLDLVISDINMPNLDGIGLIKKLRQIDHCKYIPILMLTTESANDKKMEGKAAGATGWIVKPFNPGQLINTIKKVL